MTTTEWAEAEIEQAIKIEDEKERESWLKDHGSMDGYEDSFHYGQECYKSALKAYKCLSEDGHSGFSWSITKNILTKLMNHEPLQDIEDVPEVWHERRRADINEQLEEISYQCIRYSSLFKYVIHDKTGKTADKISYSDVNRVVLLEQFLDGHTTTGHFGLVSNIVNEKYPITFPYNPANKYTVYVELFDWEQARRGCFDTVNIIKLKKPDGTFEQLNLHFGEFDNKMKPISTRTFNKRRANYVKQWQLNNAAHNDKTVEL